MTATTTTHEKSKVGEDLRSQGVAAQVPSALAGLTAGFEKGPGVPPPHDTPTKAVVVSLTAIPPAFITKGIEIIWQCARQHSKRAATQTTGRMREGRILSSRGKEEKPSTISTGKLKALLPLHCPPIQQVVCLRSYLLSQ